jgi:hypothetical protein
LAESVKFLTANHKTDAGAGAIHPLPSPIWRRFIMVGGLVKDLRTLAQHCERLARETRNEDLSRALQELGIELADKARALETKFDR